MEEYFFQMEDTKIPIYLTDGLQEIADKISENGCNRVILVYDRALDDKLVDEQNRFTPTGDESERLEKILEGFAFHIVFSHKGIQHCQPVPHFTGPTDSE